MKHTYQALEGSPPAQSRGKGSRPQPDHQRPETRLEPQPERTELMPSGLEEQEEELRPWVRKPFDALLSSLRQVKGGKELKVVPLYTLDYIKKLPKVQDMADLQARVDCLLKENGELRT